MPISVVNIPKIGGEIERVWEAFVRCGFKKQIVLYMCLCFCVFSYIYRLFLSRSCSHKCSCYTLFMFSTGPLCAQFLVTFLYCLAYCSCPLDSCCLNFSPGPFIILSEEKLNLDESDWEDIHVITGALKLFFRELPEPLVPFGFFTDIVETVSEWTATAPFNKFVLYERRICYLSRALHYHLIQGDISLTK